MLKTETTSSKYHFYTIVFLILMNLAVFGQTVTFDFVSYDDQTYILDNPQMESGLTWENIKWGLTSSYFVSWHPVTWWSYFLDAELYGINAGGFHATNVIIHILATIFLFYALLRMTARYWESLIVAVLFAIHPQHVQSVAWIAERKDVLHAMFMGLTFLAYHRFTLDRKARWYLLTMVMFALGLMSKSMLVTLPCVLFLLDFWPLNRLNDKKEVMRALVEKIPLMGLSIASAVITFVLQDTGGATASVERFGLFGRVINSLNSYVVYLYRTVWPVDLSFFYTLDPENIPVVKGILSALFLVGVTVFAVYTRKRAPQILVGWLWYLGTLVPVIGIVQVGQQANADRYTYIPLIGIFIAVVFTVHPWLQKQELRKRISKMAYVVLLFTLMLMSFKETSFWKDSALLAGRAYDVNKGNHVACHILGNIHRQYGSFEHAERFYRQCLEQRPRATRVRISLAEVLFEQGKLEESEAELLTCHQLLPEDGGVSYQLALIAKGKGNLEETRYWYEQSIQSEEPKAEYFVSYANLMAQQGELENALKAYDMAIDLEPDSLAALHNKASALFSHYRSEEALALVHQVLEIDPTYAPTLGLKEAIEAELDTSEALKN